MAILEIGKLYSPGRTEFPEGTEYNFSDAGHELRLFISSPERTEIDAVRKGRVQVGLLVEGPIIFLLFKLGSMLWSDAPFSWWIVPEARRSQPQPISDGQGALLQIVLIDAATGIVKALRSVALDTEFSRALHDAIIQQMQQPIAPQDYSNSVDRAYTKYPDTIDMVQSSIIGGLL